MPLPYNKRKLHRYGRRYAGNRRWRNYSAGMNQLWRDVKSIKNVINVEYKTVAGVFALTESSTSYDGNVITNLGLVAQGADQNQRNGNSLLAKSIMVRGTLKAQVDQNVRICIFLDRQGDGTAPTVANLLETGNAVNAVFSELNHSNGSRFKILYNKIFTMIAGTNTERRVVNIYKKLNHHIKYKGTGSAIGDTVSGTIHVLIISDHTDAAGTSASFDGRSVFRFIDN